MIFVFYCTKYFELIAPSVVKALTDLGFDVKLASKFEVNSDNDLYIIVELQSVKQPLPKHFIIYNFEQLEISAYLGPDYYAKMKKAIAVWDYSLVNVKYLKTKNIEATHVPFGYTDVLVNSDKDKNIDVSFIGGESERRKPIIDNISKIKNSFVSHNCFGNDYSDVISRSKIGINIHYYKKKPWIFEICRILPMLANGCVVISERSDDEWYDRRFEGKIFFTELEDMCEQIKIAINENLFSYRSDDQLGLRVNTVQRWLEDDFSYSKFILESGVTDVLFNK